MIVKIIIFLILFYGLTFKLKYDQLDTKLKCGRFVGAFLSSITIFSPIITYDNNAMFVVFFPFFFIVGFLFGAIYRFVKPYKASSKIDTNENINQSIIEEKIELDEHHYVMAKKTAVIFASCIAITIAIILFR